MFPPLRAGLYKGQALNPRLFRSARLIGIIGVACVRAREREVEMARSAVMHGRARDAVSPSILKECYLYS